VLFVAVCVVVVNVVYGGIEIVVYTESHCEIKCQHDFTILWVFIAFHTTYKISFTVNLKKSE
jgi:hypothetical protein